MANLYDKAGLVNIPVGYQEGFLYNIKPEDNTLGFRFNRDSAATLVNSKGLIEQVGYFGPELVKNGNFSELGSELVVNGDFSNWTNDNPDGWTITGTENENNYITEYQGKARYVSDGSTLFMSQNILTTGKFYKVTADIVVNSGGGMRFQLGANGTHHVFTTTQSIVLYAQQDGTDSNLQIIRQGATDFTIDNVSVKQVDPNDYWILGTGWSIEDGKAIRTAQSGSTSTYQSVSFSANKTYKIQYDLDITAGSFKIRIGGGTLIDTPVRTTSGTYTEYIVANSGNNVLNLRADNGAFVGTVDNVSVVEILGDKPRIDYTDSLTSPSLLLEPQSTNLLTFSEDFSQSVWAKTNLSILSNSIISPEGILSADKLIPDTTSGQHKIDITRTVTNGATVSLSAFVKKGEYNFCCLYEVTSSAGRFFDLSNGTQGGTFVGVPTTSNIENYNNDWYRISISTTVPSTSARYILYVCDTISNTSFVGDNIKGIYTWGAQLEESLYSTSYIPTAGSTVTRAQETCIGAGNVSTFNSTEGVLYAEMAALSDDGTTRYVSVSDGGNQNAIAIRFSDVNNQILAYTRIGGVFNAVLFTSSYSTVNFNKIAYRYKSGDSALFINGTKISSSTSTQTLPSNTLNTLGFNDGLYAPMEGKVKGVYVFNEALTDDELQQLTGPEYNSFAALAAAYNYTVI